MTTSMPSFEKTTHPMVPVPVAIRTVLRETARVVLVKKKDEASETLSVVTDSLLDRRLVEPVYMAEPGYPAYAASIMDGYAIHSRDKRLPRRIVEIKVLAGDAPIVKDDSNSTEPTAYYITTGAIMPESCDCVVPIEVCQVDDNTLTLIDKATVEPGKWIRPVGCDISAGSVVLPSDHVVDPVSLGLLLQSGVATVQVATQIRVGVLSTGNELVTSSSEASYGKIPDVNRPILLGLLKEFGSCCIPVDLGMERDDDLESLTNTLKEAFDTCDVVLTTGGISMGESDVLEQVLVQQLGGTLHFGRLHMKPGKPSTFVTLGDGRTTKFCFCMPGNPVSATVCTRLLVQPCLKLLYNGADQTADTHGESPEDMIYRMVENAWVHPERTMTLSHTFKLDAERPEYHRVTFANDGSVSSTGVQRSSRLMSCRDAQGLLVLPQATGERKQANTGESFTVLLLNEGSTTQVSQSLHLARKLQKSFAISVIHVVDPGTPKDDDRLKEISEQVQVALSGSKSGIANVVSSQQFAGEARDLFDVCTTNNKGDVVVVVSQATFLHHLDVATALRQRLVKVADAMALQARRGAASQDAAFGALQETVVGYTGEGSSMLVFLPQQGLQGGLQNVRGLLKHALRVARGESH